MSGGSKSHTSKGLASAGLGRLVNELEEVAVALMLGLMTVLTFVNVVLRYVFNSSIIWGLEVVLMLFAWMVLIGISYGIKVTSHLGVDAITNLLPQRGKRVAAIIAGLFCILYAVMLLKGAWDYWAPFGALQPTSGHWFPTGFETGVRDRAYFLTDQVPMLEPLRFLEDLINYGDRYDKLPKVVPYAMLPFACALILFRTVQAFADVVRGKRDSFIVSHEAEDAVAEAAATLAQKPTKQGTN